MSTLKQIKFSKKGRKAAVAGNLNEAIHFFSEAQLLSSDLKSKYENLSWLHICKALHFAKENNFLKGKEEYREFNSVHQSYIEVCNSTPGIGTETRYKTWLIGIQELLTLHRNQINLLKD